MTGVTPAARTRPPGPSLRIALVVIVVAVVIGVPAAVKAAIPVFRSFTSPVLDTPGVLHRHLSAGKYRVFERGYYSSVNLGASDVTVTAADGSTVATYDVNATSTITRNTRAFTSVVGFTIVRGGDYDIQISTSSPDQVIVARSFGDTIRQSVPWFLLSIAAGMTLVLGIILAIVGSVRRAHADRAPAMAMAFTPPGWHPDPTGAARLRYWDGARWTDYTAP